MERHGIKVDRQALAGLSEEFAKETARIEREIWDCCGVEFTIGSPAQLGEVLFDKLGYKGGRKGKSGQYSTDQAILEGLANQGAPVARMVLEWRQLSQAAGAPTPRRCRRRSTRRPGRVHTCYSLVGAQTGRLSLDRSQPAEHPDPHRDRPAHPRGVRARAGHDAARRPTTRRSSCASPRTWPTCRR